MKKKFFGAAAVVAIAVMTAFNLNLSASSNTISGITLSDIEALGACESIGWWDNDGNCVKNDNGEYFCKTDSWVELTDCKM